MGMLRNIFRTTNYTFYAITWEQEERMPDSAESSAEVIVFDAFDAAEAVAPEDGEQAARRFRTLLVDATPQADPSRACVRRARNTQGETFAVKSLFPLVGPDAGIPDRLNEDAVRALSDAFFESYRNLLLVSGVDGFPRAYGYGLVGQTPVVLMEWVEGPSLMEAAPLLPHAPEARGGNLQTSTPRWLPPLERRWRRSSIAPGASARRLCTATSLLATS